MKLINYIVLFGAVAYLYGFVKKGSSNEFQESVSSILALCSVAGIAMVFIVTFMSIFDDESSDKDNDESDDGSDDQEETESESADYEPPKCETCDRSDRWIFNGQAGFDFTNKRVALDHICLCENGGFVSDNNRSSYLKMMPTFFDPPNDAWLEERYDEIKEVIQFQEQPYFCDHPKCSTRINVIGCIFPEMNICLYLDGSCAMVLSKDDDQKLIKMDYCEEHKADGQYTFVVCDWDRVDVEPVQNNDPLEDTEESTDDNAPGDNAPGDNASGDNASGDNTAGANGSDNNAHDNKESDNDDSGESRSEDSLKN